jgi:nitroimidazol reductase NimA-like FMN-containing flavoprotein (pyridoxamine 5'-phosphate oxidase superfamily)
MREMTDEEIGYVLNHAKWGTICTVTPENRPYAVEATPYRDGGDICFMINPGGGTRRNLCQNPHVLVKMTLASRNLSWWAGVSCMGTARFDDDPDAILRGFQRLGRVMGADYTAAGEKHSRSPDTSPLLRVTTETRTGRCSAAPGEPLTVHIDSAKQRSST